MDTRVVPRHHERGARLAGIARAARGARARCGGSRAPADARRRSSRCRGTATSAISRAAARARASRWRRCMARDRADELGELLGIGRAQRLVVEQLERARELARQRARRSRRRRAAGRRGAAPRARARSPRRAGAGGPARCRGSRSASDVGVERQRAAQQALGDDGGRRVIRIVIERDLDQHAGELATAPRALRDGPRERALPRRGGGTARRTDCRRARTARCRRR